MVLSKTTSYALRILIFMASHEEEELNAKSLYEKLEIPERYLRRLLTKLSNEGLIKSTRGRNGGYSLARKIDTIYLSEIIDVFEGINSFKFCILGRTDCDQLEKCSMHDIWEDVKVNILNTFSATSLKDITAKGLEL